MTFDEERAAEQEYLAIAETWQVDPDPTGRERRTARSTRIVVNLIRHWPVILFETLIRSLHGERKLFLTLPQSLPPPKPASCYWGQANPRILFPVSE